MDSDREYDLLLGDLYGGVGDPERWQMFLQRLCTTTGSHVALLLQQDFDDGTASIPFLFGAGKQELMRYESEFSNENIWFERALPHIRTGSVNFSDDHCSKRDLKRSRYYADFLRYADICHSVGMCAQLEHNYGAFLTFCRSERAGAYAQKERALCLRLGAHWTNAHALFRQFERLRSRSQWSNESAQGVFALARDFCLIDSNRAADGMLSARWWRADGSSPLTPVCAVTSACWREAKKSVCTDETGRSATFPVHDSQRRLVAFATLRRFAAAAAGLERASYLLFVAPLRATNPTASMSRLQSLFALTPAEAQLALALREHGDLSSAADAVGIARTSARTRLQSIFDKMGLHRQAELIRMLETLAGIPEE